MVGTPQFGATLWPRPALPLMWEDDYTDVRDHIRRFGVLDVPGEPTQLAEFLYEPPPVVRPRVSEPLSSTYKRRASHTYKLKAKQREERAAQRRAEREEIDRKALERRQAFIDRERAEREVARAWWSERNPYYEDKDYIPTLIRWACVIDGDAELPADQWLWLPEPVVVKLPRKSVITP